MVAVFSEREQAASSASRLAAQTAAGRLMRA
jgi:hypothetical protein